MSWSSDPVKVKSRNYLKKKGRPRPYHDHAPCRTKKRIPGRVRLPEKTPSRGDSDMINYLLCKCSERNLSDRFKQGASDAPSGPSSNFMEVG